MDDASADVAAAIEWWKCGEPLPVTVSEEQVNHIAWLVCAAQAWLDEQ